MNKILFTVAAILLLNLAPLAFRPYLILHYKTIILVIAAASLWLSQPGFSTKETKEDKSSDKFSIVIILIMSSISVVSAVVEWAYLNNGTNGALLFTVAGLILLATGIFIRVWAIITLGKHFTATVKINSDHQLVKTGPYKFVRHPSYLGAFLAIVGTAVFLMSNYSIFISFIAMVTAYHIRINAEEKMLSSYFGKQYQDYKKSTKKIIPFIW